MKSLILSLAFLIGGSSVAFGFDWTDDYGFPSAKAQRIVRGDSFRSVLNTRRAISPRSYYVPTRPTYRYYSAATTPVTANPDVSHPLRSTQLWSRTYR